MVLPAISILVSRKMFELVTEADVGAVETAMFSTISALLLLVLEVASEVTTTELAAAGTVEAAVEAEAAVVLGVGTGSFDRGCTGGRPSQLAIRLRTDERPRVP